MAEFPSLPFFTDANLADTAHLSCLESGAYLHLLFAAWRTESCSLPNDETKLARMARCSPREWKKVRATVLAFWDYDEKTNSLTQDRLLREQQRCREYSERQARAANAKWRENKKTRNAAASSWHMPNAMPEGMPNGCQSDASSPNPNSLKKKIEIPKCAPGEISNSIPQPDWDDKANRKARWQQKIEEEIGRRFPQDEAAALIAGYAQGDSTAKQVYEMVDRNIKQRAGA